MVSHPQILIFYFCYSYGNCSVCLCAFHKLFFRMPKQPHQPWTIIHFYKSCWWCSVAQLCLTLQPPGWLHPRLPCPSLSLGVCPNSRPLSWWCHPTISSSVTPFSSCPQSFPSIRVSPNESVLHIRWPEYWSFSFSISPSNAHSGLISFRMDWFDLLAVQGTLKSLLQHHSSKASILQHSIFFMVHFSYLYMTTGETIALTAGTFVYNMHVAKWGVSV